MTSTVSASQPQQQQQVKIESPVNLVSPPVTAAFTPAANTSSAKPPVAVNLQQQQPQKETVASFATNEPAGTTAAARTTAEQLEELRKLRTTASLKSDELETAKKKEQELEAQLRRAKLEHEQRISMIVDETNKLCREIDDERTRQHEILDKATQEHEQFVRAERARIEREVGHAVDPELKQLDADVNRLREEKKMLQQQIAAANASGSEVDRLLTDAVTRVVGKMNATFEEQFKADTSFVDIVREIVRTEVKQSFVSRAQEEEVEERAQFAKDFDEMLSQWKVAEEQERFHVLRQDEQLLADLQSIAHESLDQIQKEELALQQSFLSQREQWMRSHRAALQAEMEASLQRRSLEFEEIRGLRRDAFAARIKDVEDQHLADMQRDREVYEAKVESIRETANMKQKMHDEKAKLLKDVQREAENAVGELKDVLLTVSSAVDRVDEYRRTVDEARTIVARDQDRLSAERKVMLDECQQVLSEQLVHIDQERRLLAEGTAKLESAHGTLQRQLTEERAWAQETHGRVERSRSEWEREYRKWQQVAAHERRAAEQRFADSMRELNNLAAALDDEAQAIESEIDALHRRTDDRARSVKSELEALDDRERQTQRRTEAVAQVVSDLETRSRQLGMEWQKLQAQKHELLAQRRELEQEEARMSALAEQLHLMRGQALSLQSDAATAKERKKNIDANLQAAREMMTAQSDAIRSEAARVRGQQAAAGGPGASSGRMLTMMMSRSDAQSQDRLPMKLMNEIHGMLGTTNGASSGAVGHNSDYLPNHHHLHHHPFTTSKSAQQAKQRSSPPPPQQQQPQQQNQSAVNSNRAHRSAKVDAVLQRHGISVPPPPAHASHAGQQYNQNNATTTSQSYSFTPLVNVSGESGVSGSY